MDQYAPHLWLEEEFRQPWENWRVDFARKLEIVFFEGRTVVCTAAGAHFPRERELKSDDDDLEDKINDNK